MTPENGVSFVIPVHNGARFIARVLDSVLAQADGRPMEILVVDDGSTDDSRAVLVPYVAAGKVTLLDGEKRGATAAINLAIRRAQYEIVCQVDHDVILHDGWLATLLTAIAPLDVAAAQGYYATDPGSSVWSRVMGYDLESRYARIAGDEVDHACTGTTAYRKRALYAVGLFDETFGYGYDNDLSYRLVAAGYRLLLCRSARSTHMWRESGAAYLRQQYGIGYGRLDIVRKHGTRFRGDAAAGFSMVLHAPLMLCALTALFAAGGLFAAGEPRAWWPAALAGALIVLLFGERLIVGIGAARRFHDRACLLFPIAHLLRDLAWVAALVAWGTRRVFGRRQEPHHSMPRDPSG
jgi:GT2 family glycosyltransferase